MTEFEDLTAGLAPDWHALEDAIAGELLLPDSPGYEAARRPAVARFADTSPAAIVLCATPADVAATMTLARRRGVPTAIRSGGHCFAGRSSDRGDRDRLDADALRRGRGRRRDSGRQRPARRGLRRAAGARPHDPGRLRGHGRDRRPHARRWAGHPRPQARADVQQAVVVAPGAPHETARDWLARSWAAAHPWGSGGVYPNFPEPELDDWAEAYHGANRERLLRVKARYDPYDAFTASRGA